MPVTAYRQPAPVQTRTTIQYIQPQPQVINRTIRIQAPAPAPIERTVIKVVPAPAPAPIAEPTVMIPRTVYSAPAPAPVEMAPCPAGTTQQSDGSCLQATTVAAPSYSYSPSTGISSTPSYTAPAPAPSYTAPAPREMAPCPAGTTAQADGSCMQMSRSTTYSAPTYTAPTYTAPTYTVPDTVTNSSAQYCYPNSDKRYDSLGREIIKGGHAGMKHKGQKMVPCS